MNGVARNSIARLNSDGNLDTSFDPGAGADGPVFALAVQSRGRVLMAGAFTSIDGVARPRIARLLSNGTLDASFDPGTGPDAEVTGLALESDGGVFIGGFFTNVDGRTRLGIARLLNDGDAAGGRFEFSATRQTIPESAATNLLVHIRRTGGTNGQAVVNYGISGRALTRQLRRKMPRLDGRIGDCCCHELQNVAQLANVSRPRMLTKHTHRPR